jgi:hypothetical protein
MNGGRRARQVRQVRHSGTAWLAVVALAVLGLSACTHNDPSPVSPTTSSASAQPSPTVTPPTAPKAAPTAKSAEAFVRYFWDIYNYSYAARDSQGLRDISRPACVFCKATARAIEDLAASNNTVIGSDVRLEVAVAPPTDPTVGLIVATVISERPGRTLAADGSTISRMVGFRNMKSEMALDWTNGKWLVRDIANDEKSSTPW